MRTRPARFVSFGRKRRMDTGHVARFRDAIEAECAARGARRMSVSYGRQLLVAGVLVAAWVLLARALSGVAHAPDVSMDQARAAALARVDGTVVAERYTRESKDWVYTFDIRPRDRADDAVFVTVDADRGDVIGVRSGHFVAHNAR